MNSGLLKASNAGTLLLSGTFTEAGLGTFDSNGGTININGTLDNAGSTLALDAPTGSLTLTGSIRGGTIKGADGAQLNMVNATLQGVTLNADATIQNGILDGVTLNTDLTIPNGTSVTIRKGLTLNRTLTVASSNSYTNVYFAGTQTLSGTGRLVLGDTGPCYVGCQAMIGLKAF